MIVLILFGVLVLVAIGAALAQWRAKRIQGNPDFAPTDHVELDKLGWIGHGPGGTAVSYPTEEHHDEDPPSFHMGD
jgi:hypothetical protein